MRLSREEFIESSKARTDLILDSMDSPAHLLESLIFFSVHYFDDFFKYDEECITIGSCTRVFCDYEAGGIWCCHEWNYADGIRYTLSLELSKILAYWNIWFSHFDRHFIHGNQLNQLEQEAIAFDKAGLQIAKWVKAEAPQTEVRYLHEYVHDFNAKRAESEVIID